MGCITKRKGLKSIALIKKGSSLKNKGNDELNKNNEKAALYFTIAILLEPENHTYYSNRSACYAGLTLFNEALQDAETTIKLNPNWSRVL